jgi:hypothetical protein
MNRIYAMQYPDGSIDDSILYKESDLDYSIDKPYKTKAMESRMRLMFKQEFNECFRPDNLLHKITMQQLNERYKRCEMVRVKIVLDEVRE